ncbi:MAG TPA: hypothetical protein VK453_04620 [Micromonosporaceae bacterium]|nr:hypothetical protein [Micromonosporaceae bacterium]
MDDRQATGRRPVRRKRLLLTAMGVLATLGLAFAINPTAEAAVPAGVRWQASGSWAQWSSGGYDLRNDVWGSGAGRQTIWARSGTNWGVVANHPTGGVKSYPHVNRTLNRRLSSLSSFTSSFNVTVPRAGAYSSDYDIWANNHAYEIMLWMNQYGPVKPIAERYDAQGRAVAAYRNISIGGHRWDVYRGRGNPQQVFSFVRVGNTNAATVDVLAVLRWLRTARWWGDVTINEAQFGFEISGTSGTRDFVCNSYSMNWR